MASSPMTSWQTEGEKVETVPIFFFLIQNYCRQWLLPWNEKTLAPWKESYDKPQQHVKKPRHHFADKGPYSQSYDFSSSHEWMWELNHKEDWAPKNWCFPIVVLESPLDCKEIKLVSLKGNPPWIFTGRTAAEVEAPITLVICCNELTLWKRALCWESLKAKEEGGGRGWDG